MNVSELVPAPVACESFMRNRCRFVPDLPGCYALATFSGAVLYVGLTVNLRRRMNEHLDSEHKTGLTEHGRAVLFHWWLGEDVQKVERTWMNIHTQHDGGLPVLNGIYSPTST